MNTRLSPSAVRQSIGLGEAFKGWFETGDGSKYYREAALFRVIGAVANPKSAIDVSGLSQAMAAKAKAAVEYLTRVAIGEGEILTPDNAIAGAIAHQVFGLEAPTLLVNQIQRNAWGNTSGEGLCDRMTFINAMNAFGEHKFTAGEVTQLGGAILYAATCSGGSAQSKMLATIAAAIATGTLNEVKLAQYVGKLTQEGSTFTELDGTSYSTARNGARLVQQQVPATA